MSGCVSWFGTTRSRRRGEALSFARGLRIVSVLLCSLRFTQSRLSCPQANLFVGKGTLNYATNESIVRLIITRIFIIVFKIKAVMAVEDCESRDSHCPQRRLHKPIQPGVQSHIMPLANEDRRNSSRLLR